MGLLGKLGRSLFEIDLVVVGSARVIWRGIFLIYPV